MNGIPHQEPGVLQMIRPVEMWSLTKADHTFVCTIEELPKGAYLVAVWWKDDQILSETHATVTEAIHRAHGLRTLLVSGGSMEPTA